MWKMLSIQLKASLRGLLQVKCVICYNADDYITILGMLVTNIIDNQRRWRVCKMLYFNAITSKQIGCTTAPFICQNVS